jgi:hypothetical protein
MQFLVNNDLVAPQEVRRGVGGLTAQFPRQYNSWLVNEAFEGAGCLTVLAEGRALRAYEIVELKLGSCDLEVTLKRHADQPKLH